MKLGILDFEIFFIILMMILDVILGTIDHNFFSRDSSSGGAIKSLFGKLGVTSFLIFILLVIHINDFNEFKGIDNIISLIRSGADTMAVMLIYFEATSVLAHLSNITGLDFSKLPMVQQEINSKKIKSNDYHQKVKELNDDTTNNEQNQ